MGIEGEKVELSDPHFCQLVSETDLSSESCDPAGMQCEIADLFFTEQNLFWHVIEMEAETLALMMLPRACGSSESEPGSWGIFFC